MKKLSTRHGDCFEWKTSDLGGGKRQAGYSLENKTCSIIGLDGITNQSVSEKQAVETVLHAVENARNCSECGDCLERCPYDLLIPGLIKENLQWIDNKTG
jgi:predicted aldo/keto reductase-like oxidoreductase